MPSTTRTSICSFGKSLAITESRQREMYTSSFRHGMTMETSGLERDINPNIKDSYNDTIGLRLALVLQCIGLVPRSILDIMAKIMSVEPFFH